MSRLFRFVALPVLTSLVAGTTAILTLLRKQWTDGEPVFTDWTTPVFVCLLLTIGISVLQSVVTYRDERRKARRAVYRLRLQQLGEQPQYLKAWRADPRQVSGLLSVSATKGDQRVVLMRRYIRYGELTDPSAPGDRQYIEEAPDTEFTSPNALAGWHLAVLFEPVHSDIRISSLYDRDDLHEYVCEAPIASDGSRRVLVLTESFARDVEQLRAQFAEPDKVLVVHTNHRPDHGEVASFFNVIRRLQFDINGQVALATPLEESMLTYEFIIGGELRGSDYQKALYYFGVGATFQMSPATAAA